MNIIIVCIIGCEWIHGWVHGLILHKMLKTKQHDHHQQQQNTTFKEKVIVIFLKKEF